MDMSTSHTIRSCLRPLFLAVLFVIATACNRNRPGDVDPSQGATLIFANESLSQAEVFAVMPGVGARKLATVMAGRTEEIVVPSDIVRRGGGLNLVARLLARSNTPGSGPITLQPGDRLSVRLPLDTRYLYVLPAS
jgi:hypothetical protein